VCEHVLQLSTMQFNHPYSVVVGSHIQGRLNRTPCFHVVLLLCPQAIAKRMRELRQILATAQARVTIMRLLGCLRAWALWAPREKELRLAAGREPSYSCSWGRHQPCAQQLLVGTQTTWGQSSSVPCAVAA
jgi:hypothetical protein